MRITLLVLVCLVSVITFGQKTDGELNTQNNNTIFTATLTPTRVGNMFEQSILSKVNKRTPIFLDSADITKRIKFNLTGLGSDTTRNVVWPNKSGTVAFLDDIVGSSIFTNGITNSNDTVRLGGNLTLETDTYIDIVGDIFGSVPTKFGIRVFEDVDVLYEGIFVDYDPLFVPSARIESFSAGVQRNLISANSIQSTDLINSVASTLSFGGANFIFTDGKSSKNGIRYAGSGYVTDDRSLTDRGYVLGSKVFTGKQIFTTPTTSTASITLPHGVAPSSPINGDIWTTTTSVYARVNGSTVDLGGSGDVTKVGTPADDQVGVWTGDGTIEGTSGLTYNGSTLSVTGAVSATGAVSGSNLSGTNTGDQTITLTGDVTGSGTGSFATTIASGAVDIAMLSATGTADSMSVLYGNNTWRVPSTPLITVSGTTLTLDNTYNGKIINATNASGLTITVPTGLVNHFSCGVWRASGAGDVSLSASGTTLNGLGLTLTVEETALSLIQQGQTNEFIVVGAVGSQGITGTTGTTSGNVIVASGAEGSVTSRSLNIDSEGLLSATKESAINNSIDIGLGLRKRTTGTAAIGIGTGIQVQMENASGTDVIVAQESFIATGVTASSESVDYSLSLRNSGSNAERLRVKSTGQIQLNNYTSSSSFSGTPVGYLQYDASGNVITSAVPSGGGSSRPMTITLHSNATANITLTNQPNSEQFLSNSNRNIWLVDFTGYDSVKISFRTITGSASANSPRIKLEYATTFGANTTDYSPIGTGATEVSAAISTTNDLTNSGWVALTAAAKGEVYIALMQDGGDGVEDPAIASITVTVK